MEQEKEQQTIEPVKVKKVYVYSKEAKAEYNRRYYEKYREKINKDQLERYHKNKSTMDKQPRKPRKIETEPRKPRNGQEAPKYIEIIIKRDGEIINNNKILL